MRSLPRTKSVPEQEEYRQTSEKAQIQDQRSPNKALTLLRMLTELTTESTISHQLVDHHTPSDN